jgi:hypothetical protein
MPLTGHLSDLSLSELIEFFCNQRKTGRLKVLYPTGSGHFFLQNGSVIDAQIGVLRGIEAVYYALTLPNAKFEFSASNDNVERTINQPWTQVVLEGLRRLDEGVIPEEAFPPGYTQVHRDDQSGEGQREREPISVWITSSRTHLPAFLSFMSTPSSSKRKPLTLGAVGMGVVAIVAVIGVPAGWYRQNQIPLPQEVTVAGSSTPVASTSPALTELPTKPAATEASPAPEPSAATPRRPPRERKSREEKTTAMLQPAVELPPVSVRETPKPGAKKVVVSVTYDESGRVTQAYGGDAAALRIARQKRFPAGSGGSATITIPIN